MENYNFPDEWFKTGPVILDQELATASNNNLLLFYAPEGLYQLENASRIGIDCTFRVPKEYLQVMVICSRKSGKDSSTIACFMKNKSSQAYDQVRVQNHKNLVVKSCTKLIAIAIK